MMQKKAADQTDVASARAETCSLEDTNDTNAATRT